MMNGSGGKALKASGSIRSQVILDRLRSKSSHLRSFTELSKATRTVLLDRRFSLDQEEKEILQKCLDQLQEKIPVRSASGMAERLETIGRKIGLKFMAAPVHGCYYLSTEMFYVEINIDQAGNVNEAKIHHLDATQTNPHPNAQNCPEIIECLSKNDFATFIKHLDGLVAIYNLNPATSPQKSQAWNALSAMESDLELIYRSYESSCASDPWFLVHQTSCGMIHPRSGGLPMSIRYFLPPYELIDETTNTLMTADVSTIETKDLGFVVTPTIENSEASCLLPLKSLVRVNPQGNVVTEDMDPSNSVSLPARFSLKLKTPIALSLEKCREIEHLTNIAFFDESEAMPLMQLITQNKTNQLLDTANNRGLFVTLPDQQHCYFLSDPPDFRGVMISAIPFTHPNSVPSIIGHLRQQALFNTLIESCARVNSIQDLEKSVMFEVSCTDLTHITITFEHPSDESMATVELDLTHVNQIACQIYTSSNVPVCPEELANKVIQKCMSIPITMRSLIRYGQSKLKPAVQEPDTEMALANNSFFNGNTDGGGQYTRGNENGNAPNNPSLDSKYGREGNFGGVPGNAQPGPEESMETDRGGGASDSTGFGEYIKDEPMDYEHDSSTFKSGAGSLNEYGPQDATFNPEASSSVQPKSSSSSSSTPSTTTTNAMPKHKVSSSTSGSSSTVSLKLKTEPGTGKSEPSGHESMLLPPKMEHIKPEFSLTKASPSNSNEFKTGKTERRDSSVPDIKPLVSITPVSSSTCSISMSKKSSGGIEIIPLGGSSDKDKSRELIRRSLSEDDKRRMEKKSMSSKKRKHLSSSRVSTGDGLSSSKKKLLDGKGGKGKLDSVINRLQNPGSESSIELVPKGKEPSKVVTPKSSSSLKLTIKAPNKFPSPSGKESKPKSSSSSPSSKDKSSSKHSSSSSKSSSHRSHGSSSQGSSSKSSKSTSDKDRKRSSHGSSSSSRSSSTDRDRDRHQREREEVKKLLDGGKLNKTFQIPKLSKSSSPSTAKESNNRLTPTTSPKQSLLSYSSNSSPKYIGGGSVTPPNISPKHPYSAPSSVPPLPTTSPNTTPKASSRTPSASPTYGVTGTASARLNAPHTFLTPDKSSGLEGSANVEALSSLSGPAKTAKEMEEILDDSTASFLLGK